MGHAHLDISHIIIITLKEKENGNDLYCSNGSYSSTLHLQFCGQPLVMVESSMALLVVDKSPES